MEEQQTQEQEQQTSPVLTLQLNVEQISAVIAGLDELPTKANVWPLKQIIAQQANAQLQQLNQAAEAGAEPPSTVQ